MKETIIYIDGENLAYRIGDILVKKKIISDKNEIVKYDFKHLFGSFLSEEQLKSSEIRYYGTKIKASGLKGDSRSKALDMIESQRRLKRSLEKQNIKFITCGTLQFRDGRRCRNCGKKTSFFQEKGVDVKMAVDIVTDSLDPKLKKMILVSSDSDLLPAIKQVGQRGIEVEYVFIDNKLNWGIVHNSTKKHNVSKRTITEGYEKANK